MVGVSIISYKEQLSTQSVNEFVCRQKRYFAAIDEGCMSRNDSHDLEQ